MGSLQLRTQLRTEVMNVDYVTVRELREKSGDIWQRVEAGEEFVVTRNGKPFALLVHTEPAAVEEKLRALRLQAFKHAWEALAGQAQENGSAGMTDEEIQAEIDAVREERHRASIRGA
jgi:prevent-host-death family protein